MRKLNDIKLSKVSKFFSKKSIYEDIALASNSATYFYDLAKPKWTARNFTKFADEGYSKNVIAHRSISLISKSVGSIKFEISADGKKLNNHPILNLLFKPNPSENGFLFFESLISYRQISGNAFILCVKNSEGEVSELYNLRPDRVSIVTDSNGSISA